MKSQLRKWLSEGEFQQIIDNASEHGRTVNTLISLTYDTDPLIHWRALDAVGRCAEKLCTTRAEALKNLLRRLFWQMSDEAGSMAWHAPEAIGEIVQADPHTFADFIPLTVSLLYLEPEDLPRFLPGTLYALGRIGEKQPDAVKGGFSRMLEALSAIPSTSPTKAIPAPRTTFRNTGSSGYIISLLISVRKLTKPRANMFPEIPLEKND